MLNTPDAIAGDGSLRLRGYQLDDNLQAERGRIFLTGTQALVRLPLMQRRLDRQRGLNTAGFVSGYRGSPLGGYDKALWQARSALEEHDIRFVPAVNEELAATAVLGSQQVESDSHRTADGVFAIWYGKGPGVDRAGDALKHGTVYGSSPHGGVLVVAGDDHGCMSSSMPHQSDFAMQAWGMPVVNPATLAEYLEFGLYGWALSRFSGAWVGFKAISETVESGATVDLDAIPWPAADQPVDFERPSGGLHYRWPDFPSLSIEARHAAKLDAVRAYAKHHAIDKFLCPSPTADIGIVTCGKAHLDVMEVVRMLGLDTQTLDQAGVRLYKVGLSFPIEPTRMMAFRQGLREVLVVEEKGAFVERQIKNLCYNLPDAERPRVIGKTDVEGAPLLPSEGELRPSRIAKVLADWLARHKPSLDRRPLLSVFTAPGLLSNAADNLRRMPYFCSGCPHSTSTKVPEGSRALAGIGCHFMASWMNRDTGGLIQMGGEGADWVSHAMFTTTRHVFQNLGDGTYFHSGFLAVRQAIATRTNITYKILYNDAVAMTGGQPVEGNLTVDAIARQLAAEGASAIVLVSDAPEKYKGHEARFPKGTRFYPRSELDGVQRELREVPGVTVLIYDQACAAELRRRRKKKEIEEPPRRLFINTDVCEGCGDCGKQSNCLSIVPVETELGRKRAIDQSSCNKDQTCVNGFCPSFVSVTGGRLRKASPLQHDEARWRAMVRELPMPDMHARGDGPHNLLVTGVGGTGVVTVGALIAMAAHLELKHASVLDFMGFSQKAGAVLSFVRLSAGPEGLNQARIDLCQTDALLACDMVVAASNEALQTVRHGHTRVVANPHLAPTAALMQDPDAPTHGDALMAKLRHAAGTENVEVCQAHALAQRFFGDTIGANILLMGFAWQQGLIPVGLEALERAIELNGVAVEANKAAFAVGRLAAGMPHALARLTNSEPTALANDLQPVAPEPGLEQLIDHRAALLVQYQGPRLARHYRRFVASVQARESEVTGEGSSLPLTRAVATQYARLLAYKDEYEVARLYTNGDFARELARHFEGKVKLSFHMAPPLLSIFKRNKNPPAKIEFGPWMKIFMRILTKAKFLRGTPFDVFGHTAERRQERQLIADYATRMKELMAELSPKNIDLAIEIAGLPQKIRGYGHIKAASIEKVREKERELLSKFQRGTLAEVVSIAGAQAKNQRTSEGLPSIPIYVESR